jgi:hypothetical protein
MKVFWKMPSGLRGQYRNELNLYNKLYQANELLRAWHHLERAHIIAQPWAVEHTQVHWNMLVFGCRIKNYREILGQIPRLLVGGVKSFVGKVPLGNTGGANVPPLQRTELPGDLKEIMRPYAGQ